MRAVALLAAGLALGLAAPAPAQTPAEVAELQRKLAAATRRARGRHLVELVPTLAEADRQRVIDAAASLAEVAVVPLVVVHGHPGVKTPEAWAVDRFGLVRLGDPHQDNGLLVALFTEPRALVVESGAGLEADLPDAKVAAILDTVAAPLMAKDRWGEALAAALEAMDTHLRGGDLGPVERAAGRTRVRPVPVPLPPPAPVRPAPPPPGLFEFFLTPAHAPILVALIWALWALSLPMRHIFANRRFFLAGALVLGWGLGMAGATGDAGVALVTLLLVAAGASVAGFTLSRRCPRCPAGYLEEVERVLREATATRAGVGEVTRDCPRCPFHQVETFEIPRIVYTESTYRGRRRVDLTPPSTPEAFGGRSSGGGGSVRSF